MDAMKQLIEMKMAEQAMRNNPLYKIGRTMVLTSKGLRGELSASDMGGSSGDDPMKDFMMWQLMSQQGIMGDSASSDPKSSVVGDLAGPSDTTAQSDFEKFREQVGIPKYSTMEGTIAGKMFGQDPVSKAFMEVQKNKIQKQDDANIDIKTASMKDTDKELHEKFGQAARVVQAFRNLSGLGKAVDSEFKYGSGPIAQLASDVSQFRYSPASLQKATEPVQAYTAQMQELKIALLPILSGQARYVVDLANAIQQTVPPVGKIKSVRDTLNAQSVRNTMSLVYGIQNGFFGADSLREMGIDPNSPLKNKDEAMALLKSVKLTPEQEKSIEDAVDYVVKAPRIKKGKISKQSEKENKIKSLGLDPSRFEIVE